jgi:lambda family phage tail tape measure protein
LNKTLESVKDNVENKAELYEWYVARRNEILKDTYEKEKSWQDGILDGMNNYADSVMNVYSSVENTAKTALDSMSDTFVEFCATGSADFSDMAQSIIKDIMKIYIQSQITGPLAKGLGSLLSGLFSSGGSVVSNAHGNVFPASPSLSAYSNSIVSKPTTFAFAKGAGLMGEAGYEGILPLKRMPNSNLGVEAEIQHSNQTKPVNIELNITNESGQPVAAQETGRRMNMEKMIMDIVLTRVGNNTGGAKNAFKSALSG